MTPVTRRAHLLIIAVLLLAYVPLLNGGWLPIPRGPMQWVVPASSGEAVAAQPIDAPAPPEHPYLAGNGRNSMHNDAYASDAYTTPGPLGRNTQVMSALYGIKECATLAFDSQGDLIGLCGGIRGPQLMRIDPETLAVEDRHTLPGRVLRSGVSPLEDLCGGAYFYLDQLDRAVVATTNREIHIIGPQMTLIKKVTIRWVPDEDCLIALLPDWSGRIWFVTRGARVGVVEPSSGATHAVTLEGESIANSFAADETGGVFIVSDHALYRFDFGATGPVVTWRQPYDRGSRRKPGQLSQGSGTTPTLMSGGRVAITDNADPRMNVLVYQRDSGRPICGVPVFQADASATENSLIAVGDSLLAENNFGYSPIGFENAPGVARVDVGGDSCRVVWTSEVSAPTSVPKASVATGLAYVYARDGLGWYLCGIDLRTGKTAFRVLAGPGLPWNNHYAAMTLGPDGSAYIATLSGLVRFRDSGGLDGRSHVPIVVGSAGHLDRRDTQRERGQPPREGVEQVVGHDDGEDEVQRLGGDQRHGRPNRHRSGPPHRRAQQDQAGDVPQHEDPGCDHDRPLVHQGVQQLRPGRRVYAARCQCPDRGVSGREEDARPGRNQQDHGDQAQHRGAALGQARGGQRRREQRGHRQGQPEHGVHPAQAGGRLAEQGLAVGRRVIRHYPAKDGHGERPDRHERGRADAAEGSGVISHGFRLIVAAAGRMGRGSRPSGKSPGASRGRPPSPPAIR